ncbi:SsgA family sporulation/cell division regulator [Streptomyces sp. NPDC005262]|uniref:SsgA family sporulation/cell division regulator n=1 Tax=Streptomyces sp. NPDC005262 TaxID=3364710 RepID=UPI00367FAE41
MLDMELASPLGERILVPTHLLSRSQDPLAVQLLFQDGLRGPVPWVFARDLLTTGTQTLSGDGDVQVWPGGSDPEALPHLLPSSPRGCAHLTASLPAIERWLHRTYQLVPAARETEALDLETHLAQFLDKAS